MSTNPNMEAIETITVGATSVASIDFNNIPQTYTDLVIKISVRSAATGSIARRCQIRFNGASTDANLTFRRLYGDGSGTGSDSGSTGHVAWMPDGSATANGFSNIEVYIPNYTSSNNKSFSADGVQENNATAAYMGLFADLWSNTAAITSIKIFEESGSNLVQYSSATLYGVTSAGLGAKATGGIITSDADYIYHTFYSSGTFIPTVNLTADYLVVAGGGGGGSAQDNSGSSGGGGGAGGLRCTVGATGGGGSLESALSLTASTSYTVTVGAGGSAGGGNGSGSNGSNSVFSTITSTGGGAGGGTNTSGSNGGSGGGAGGWDGGIVGGTGTTNQGYAGGEAGGGGGGAGASGSNGANRTGSPGSRNGGNGVTTIISGTSRTYAGGGGGGASTVVSPPTFPIAAGSGGSGGGGVGQSTAGGSVGAGTANTGGGGGGGGAFQGSSASGGAGGSGIVIVRYAK